MFPLWGKNSTALHHLDRGVYAVGQAQGGHRLDRSSTLTRRDRELQARGYTVLRFAYREVTEAPEAVIAALRAHLRRPI